MLGRDHQASTMDKTRTARHLKTNFAPSDFGFRGGRDFNFWGAQNYFLDASRRRPAQCQPRTLGSKGLRRGVFPAWTWFMWSPDGPQEPLGFMVTQMRSKHPWTLDATSTDPLSAIIF